MGRRGLACVGVACPGDNRGQHWSHVVEPEALWAGPEPCGRGLTQWAGPAEGAAANT